MTVRQCGGFNETNEYRHVCLIGGGGLASVQLFWKTNTDVLRAVKFRHQQITNHNDLQRFQREVSVLHENRHPGIVQFFSYGVPKSESTTPPWIELEFIPGGTASDFIAKEARQLSIDETETAIILYGTAVVLNFLHRRNVVHRDVKPGNILLDRNLEPRLADFGFAKRLDLRNLDSHPYTLRYAAPEMVAGVSYDHKADVFSFGMVMWEMRTLSVPYADQPLSQICSHILEGKLQDLPSGDPYSDIVHACLKKAPNDRPQLTNLLSLLEKVIRSIPTVDLNRFDRYCHKIQEGITFQEAGLIGDLISVADTGRPQSAYQLGCLYLHGFGVEQNPGRGIELLIKAAEMDEADAISLLLELAESEEIELSDSIRQMLCEKRG
jgi:serine/threonine protein kinase